MSDEAEIRERKRKEENKPPSRIPGMRDAAKKMAKIVSPGCVRVTHQSP